MSGPFCTIYFNSLSCLMNLLDVSFFCTRLYCIVFANCNLRSWCLLLSWDFCHYLINFLILLFISFFFCKFVLVIIFTVTLLFRDVLIHYGNIFAFVYFITPGILESFLLLFAESIQFLRGVVVYLVSSVLLMWSCCNWTLFGSLSFPSDVESIIYQMISFYS